MSLPVLAAIDGDMQVLDPDTGEVLSIRDASDHALATAAREIADLDRQLFAAKRALASELRDRHGVGVVHAGGHAFEVKEAQSWPAARTREALVRLTADGHIGQVDADRAMPAVPKPDARALKALAGRLAVTDPDAARVLADACTVSAPSLRGVRVEAVDEEAAS